MVTTEQKLLQFNLEAEAINELVDSGYLTKEEGAEKINQLFEKLGLK